MKRLLRPIFGSLLVLFAGMASAQRGDLLPALSPQAAPHAQAATVPQPVPPAGQPLTKTDVDAWLDGYLPYALHVGDIPGATVSIVKDGQILTARGYGYSDVAKRTPVDPNRTLFRPGSVSKLVTWTAVMQLVEAGKINLDADVNTYLDFKIPSFDGKPITMRQIMTHTSGFNEASKDVIYFAPRERQTLEQYVKAALPSRIYAPGTTPAYSNYATALAGYIVQRLSGQDFDSYVEQHIFAPAGMMSSTFRQPLPANLAPQMSEGYSRGTGPAKPFELCGPAPAGSLSTTATDMARFMIAHLQDGQIDGHRILEPATAQMMHNSPLGPINPRSLIPPLNRMELGFFETNVNGREVIGHLGDTEFFHTSLHLFMHENVGLFVSFNSPGKEGAAHTLRIALFQDFADRYFPSTEKDGRVDPQTAAAHARMMAGSWDASRASKGNFFSITSFLGQTKLSVGPKGELVAASVTGPSGVPRHWTEIAPFVWRDADGHDRLAAQVVNGKVNRWSYDLPAPFEVFDRTPASQNSAWLQPALIASLAVLVLTFLYWPAAWYVRRRYAAPLAVTGESRRAYRATRIFAALDVAVLVGWLLMIQAMIADVNKITPASDPMLWFLQIAGLLIFPGAVLLSGWNLYLAFRDNRRWTRKLWSVLVLLATLIVLYFAATFGLIAMTVKY